MESEVRELLVEELKDAYSAEKQALRCMQKALRMASAPALREGIELHIEQTQTQIERVEQAMEKLQTRPGRKVCEAMRGLVEEAQHSIGEQDGKGPILDLVIVAGMQRIEHYEIAAYGTDIALAEALGEQEVVDLLTATLEEEKQTDLKLTEVTQQEIMPAALAAEDETEEELPGRKKTGGGRTLKRISRSGAAPAQIAVVSRRGIAWVMAPTPTVPPPQPENLSSSLKRSIEALEERRRQEAASATRQERLAEAITSFTGSMPFVYLHVALYVAWILANLGFMPGIPMFDPSFVILAMEASVEAIFLSTFVLISQNRSAAAANKRADLDLHINLLAEHELTKLTEVVMAMATRLDVQVGNRAEIEEVKKDVAPEAVLDALDARDQ